MAQPNKLAKIISDAISSINARLDIIETKISMLAINAGLVEYCDCNVHGEVKILEGMPCCAICEKIIKGVLEANLG